MVVGPVGLRALPVLASTPNGPVTRVSAGPTVDREELRRVLPPRLDRLPRLPPPGPRAPPTLGTARQGGHSLSERELEHLRSGVGTLYSEDDLNRALAEGDQRHLGEVRRQLGDGLVTDDDLARMLERNPLAPPLMDQLRREASEGRARRQVRELAEGEHTEDEVRNHPDVSRALQGGHVEGVTDRAITEAAKDGAARRMIGDLNTGNFDATGPGPNDVEHFLNRPEARRAIERNMLGPDTEGALRRLFERDRALKRGVTE